MARASPEDRRLQMAYERTKAQLKKAHELCVELNYANDHETVLSLAQTMATNEVGIAVTQRVASTPSGFETRSKLWAPVSGFIRPEQP